MKGHKGTEGGREKGRDRRGKGGSSVRKGRVARQLPEGGFGKNASRRSGMRAILFADGKRPVSGRVVVGDGTPAFVRVREPGSYGRLRVGDRNVGTGRRAGEDEGRRLWGVAADRWQIRKLDEARPEDGAPRSTGVPPVIDVVEP